MSNKHEPPCPESSGIYTYAHSPRACALGTFILKYTANDEACHGRVFFFLNFILGKSEETNYYLKK